MKNERAHLCALSVVWNVWMLQVAGMVLTVGLMVGDGDDGVNGCRRDSGDGCDCFNSCVHSLDFFKFNFFLTSQSCVVWTKGIFVECALIISSAIADIIIFCITMLHDASRVFYILKMQSAIIQPPPQLWQLLISWSCCPCWLEGFVVQSSHDHRVSH